MVVLRKTQCIVYVLAVVSFSLTMPVQSLGADETTGLTQQLLADAADGNLDEFSLLEASLIASGIEDGHRIATYIADFSSLVTNCESVVPAAMQPLAGEEAIYNTLHEQLLTGQYHSTCTEVDRAFDDGDYNCVTATILYQCLCEEFELSPTAVATSTHVRSRFLAPSTFDVETTCAEWFDVVHQKPSTQTLRQNQRVRQLTDIELLAKIYYNRGVSRLETKAFFDGVALLEISQSLDPADKPTRKNLAAGINNWALAECDAGHFEHAIELVVVGIEKHPEFTPLLANDIHIHQRYASQLLQQQRFAQAMQVLQGAFERRPDVDLFNRGRLAVLGQWTVSLLMNDQLRQAAALFETASTWCDSATGLAECKAAATESTVQQLREQGDHTRADALLNWTSTPSPLL